MLAEKKILRTTIHSDLLHGSLKRGGLLSGGGALLLVVGGTMVPLELLSLWGLPFFIFGLLFVGLGLMPYKRLAKLQLFPHELHINQSKLLFCKSGKPLFDIPLNCVERAKYIEKEHLYGIGIWLKKPIVEKVKVMQQGFDVEAYQLDSRMRFEGCDIFLPYFSKRAYYSFKGLLGSNRAS